MIITIYPVNSSLIFLVKNECIDLNSISRHGKCLGAACKCKFALAFSKGLQGTFAPLSVLLLAEAVKFFTCVYMYISTNKNVNAYKKK